MQCPSGKRAQGSRLVTPAVCLTHALPTHYPPTTHPVVVSQAHIHNHRPPLHQSQGLLFLNLQGRAWQSVAERVGAMMGRALEWSEYKARAW